MPKTALMRHGKANKPPHGLKYGDCQKVLMLTEAVAEEIKEDPVDEKTVVVSAEDHDSVKTAEVVSETLETTTHTHSALSEKGSAQDMDLFVGWMLTLTAPLIIITHRCRVKWFFRSLMRLTGRRLQKIPSFRYKFIELFPKAILVDTSTMKIKTVRAKKHAVRKPALRTKGVAP